MSVALTEKEFSQHLNSKFQLEFGDQKLELELVEVKAYLPQGNEREGMERFSVFFEGPGGTRLPQSVYSLTHDQMGEFDIFLVPISGDRKGFRYEAVFNYFKKSEPPAVAGGP
jgi:hypothetical protein